MGSVHSLNMPVETAPKPAQSTLSALLSVGRPLVMGILNVTPDFFRTAANSWIPRWPLPMPRTWPMPALIFSTSAQKFDATLWRGCPCLRPCGKGAARAHIAGDHQTRLTAIIDTIKASIADWALEQGAAIVNDVWGLQRDPDMAPLVAERGVPVIVMHNRESADDNIDIIAEVIAFFARSLEIAARAGIASDNIVLDPGIGFGKTPEQSITCIARLTEFKRFGLPLLVGASRKRFINAVTPSAPDDRIGGSISAHLLAVAKGAAIVRAHDVKETVQALRVAAAIEAAR